MKKLFVYLAVCFLSIGTITADEECRCSTCSSNKIAPDESHGAQLDDGYL